ncbi:unnamed protein product [marine sediment metagenome]|uniref:Uncharacterized protein n=1 Tax=marine sediment metagenome TaxID=412755 RepID=X1QHH9_9ZZZZ
MDGKYTVTDVNQRKRFTPGGKQVTYYDIYILTQRGATGSLRVVAADYDIETVRPKLEELAAKLDMPFEL